MEFGAIKGVILKYLILLLLLLPLSSFGKTYKSSFRECQTYENSTIYRGIKNKRMSFLKYKCELDKKSLSCIVYKNNESNKLLDLKLEETSASSNGIGYFDKEIGARVFLSEKTKKIALNSPYEFDQNPSKLKSIFCNGTLKVTRE